jgi:transposase
MAPLIGSYERAWWCEARDGMRVDAIAAAVQCGAKTVRIHLKRLNEQGLDGLGDRPRPGRHARLTEAERSRIIALATKPAPGSLQRQRDGTLEARAEQASAQWSLDALTQAAHQAGDPTHFPARRGALASDAQLGQQ